MTLSLQQRRRYARYLWAFTIAWLLVQLASLRTGWLNAFFFDTTAPLTQGVDFFPLPRAFDNLLDGRSIYNTFHSGYGPYATWFVYHPAVAFLAAPLILLAPWTAYALWTVFSVGMLALSAFLLGRAGGDPLRRASVGLLLLGSFPGFLTLYSGNAQALLVLSVALVLLAVDRMRKQGPTRAANRMLLAGLLLSLFSKPIAFAMLPLLLLLRETRRTALRALVIYALVSAAFLVVPGLNPVAMSWTDRIALFKHPATVAAINPLANGFYVVPPMQDNIVHWLVMLALNGYRMLHVDVYSLSALIDMWRGSHTPDVLFRVPLIVLLGVTVLVACMRSAGDRLEAAVLTLMAASLVVLLSYGLIWEYHFTLLLPVAGLLLTREHPGWFERSIIALAWIKWMPSVYVVLRHQDLARLSTEAMLHSERILLAVAMFCLLLFRAAQLALTSRGGLRFLGSGTEEAHPALAS